LTVSFDVALLSQLLCFGKDPKASLLDLTGPVAEHEPAWFAPSAGAAFSYVVAVFLGCDSRGVAGELVRSPTGDGDGDGDSAEHVGHVQLYRREHAGLVHYTVFN
jgi:hypothetical protein